MRQFCASKTAFVLLVYCFCVPCARSKILNAFDQIQQLQCLASVIASATFPFNFILKYLSTMTRFRRAQNTVVLRISEPEKFACETCTLVQCLHLILTGHPSCRLLTIE
ncbi:hypothetical protein BJ741DRAFT_10569 [Chytriomyces cf. hyalinus JEL632]|nr:hypothetical protein BJ741DRAFT_10569 [Chytriomyces cf. hyalinus JEL632]